MRLQSIEDVVNRRNNHINMRNCRNVSLVSGTIEVVLMSMVVSKRPLTMTIAIVNNKDFLITALGHPVSIKASEFLLESILLFQTFLTPHPSPHLSLLPSLIS